MSKEAEGCRFRVLEGVEVGVLKPKSGVGIRLHPSNYKGCRLKSPKSAIKDISLIK
mgnify:CR=1 FL=1